MWALVCAGEDGSAGRLRSEDPLPAGHHGAGKAVANDIDGRACHVHHRIDAQDDEDRLGREMEGGDRRKQDDQHGARHARHTLAGEHQRAHHQELLAERQMNAPGLRDKDAGDGEIERGTVKVEAVSGRDDEGDHAPRHAKGLHVFHGTGQRGLAGRSGKRDRGGLGDRGQKARHGHPEQQSGRQQNSDRKDHQRAVKRQ